MRISDNQTREMTSAGLNLIAQALSIYDAELRLVVCNARFQKMFDLPDALVTPGASFARTMRALAKRGEYGHIADIEEFVKERCDRARAFEPHYMERTRSNGRTISVEGSPLPQGGWVTVYTDITAAKTQEALLLSHSDALSDQVLAYTKELSATNRELASMITTLEETKRQLTTSEARTRETTQMMPAHIAHVDEEGIYTFSNQRLPDILPDTKRNIVGLHLREALGAFAFGRISAALTEAYEGTPSVSEFTDEASARRIRTAFTPDREGGVYILSTDITAETQARVALQQTRKRELAAQMISGLAHDFSNLLTIILGMQSRLAKVPDMSADAQDLVDGTIAAARRGGALLGSIADVTSPRPLRPGAYSTTALLDDIATLARPALPEKVSLATRDEIPQSNVLIDKGQITDSVLNLIFNARDACGASGHIRVTQRLVHKTWLEWEICDDGPGFSASALERAIEPFFTTKGSEGSGLGLSMVYDMTKSAGGDLRLRNTAEGGARVLLRLPYRPALQAPAGLVLLVEDNSDIRAGIRDMLMQLGHSVIEAVSADEATALLADLPEIAAVLSDIQLVGEATGLDLADRIGTDIPVIIMTSLSPCDSLFKRAQRRAPVLRKPFDAPALQALLQSEPIAAQ